MIEELLKIKQQVEQSKVLIFDFDGVIADSVEVKTEAFASMYEPYGMDVVDKSVKNAINNGIDCIKNSAAKKYPYDDDSFHLVTATDMLEHLHINDVDTALKQIFRVLKSNHYALLAPATKPDLTGYFHLTVKNKDWWVSKCEEIGFLFIKFIGKDGIVFKKE